MQPIEERECRGIAKEQGERIRIPTLLGDKAKLLCSMTVISTTVATAGLR
jgi:hypothetical protein